MSTSDDASRLKAAEAPIHQVNHRWWVALVLITAAVAIFFGLPLAIPDNATLRVALTMLTVIVTAFCLVLWWVLLSGFSWTVRLAGVAFLIGLAGVTATIVRLEGVDGNMVPTQWSFRWNPDRDTRAREYFASATPASAPATETNAAVAAAAPPEPLTIAATDWPAYRGAERDGIVHPLQLVANWSEHPPKQLWEHPLGAGWSSFAVVGDNVYTQEQRDANECVVCYGLNDGKQRWIHEDPTIFEASAPMGGPGPRATPTVTPTRLYSLGATGVLNCLEPRTGAVVWKRNILEDSQQGPSAPVKNIDWGMSGSPWAENDRVYVTPGSDQNKAVICYNALDGAVIWSAGQHPGSYHSARTYTLLGVPQLLAFHGDGLTSYSLDGKELWFVPWTNQPKVNVAEPIQIGDHSLIFGNGYGVGFARLELAFDGTAWQPKLAWETSKLKPKFNSVVARGKYVYGLDDGILTCVDVDTGKPRWKQGRFSYGQLLLIGDKLLILSESGEVAVVKAQPEKFEQLAQFQALGNEITWNHPVVVPGRLLVRNARDVACYVIETEPAVESGAEVTSLPQR